MKKIKLLQDHPVLGTIAKADDIVELHDGVADDLVARGIAEEVSKPKPKAKKGDK